MNLFDLYENREPYQLAIDKLEQRRIKDLEAKMDDYARRGMKDEFQKCKAERDSYHKVKNTSVDEAGIGQDLVTPQQRVQQATPQKQTPVQKVGSTVKHAANWLAGKGGPGKEGPTYEETELDEQQTDSNVNAVRLVWAQIIKAVADNVDFATITWPNGQTQKFTRNQLWHLDQKPRTMSRQAKNQWALKYLSNLDNLMYYLGNLKTGIKPRPQLKTPVDPEQPQLDLPKPLEERGQKKNSNDSQLTSPKDLIAQTALRVARQRNPAARNDLEAFVKDEISTREKTNQELEQLRNKNSTQDASLSQVLSLNKQQEQEITGLNQEISTLDGKLSQAIAAIANKPVAPVPTPKAKEPAKEKEKPTRATSYEPTYYAPPSATTTADTKTDNKIADLRNEIDKLNTMLALKTIKAPDDRAETRQDIKALQAQIANLSRPRLPNTEPNTLPQVRSKYKGTAPEIPAVPAGSNDINLPTRAKQEPEQEILPAQQGKTSKTDSLKKSAQAAQRHKISPTSGDDVFNIYDEPIKEPAMAESKMSELDIARQDLERMNERQFYVAYGISKAAFQQKYRTLLKPAKLGYTQDIAEGPDLLNMSDLQFYKELLAVILIPVAGLGAAAWHKIKNALKLYRAEDVINALNKKGITVDRGTFEQIKPLLLKLEQAIDVDKDGDAAKDLAKRIQQTVAWGKLKQAPVRPETPAQGQGEQGVAEAANPAQQAAIAIAMKKAGKKPESVDEMDKSQPSQERHGDYPLGTPTGTPAKPVKAKKVVKDLAKDLDNAFDKVKEEKTRLDPKCWTGKKIGNPKTKVKGGVRVNNCVPVESVDESYTGVMQSQGITDDKLLKAAARIDRLAESFK